MAKSGLAEIPYQRGSHSSHPCRGAVFVDTTVQGWLAFARSPLANFRARLRRAKTQPGGLPNISPGIERSDTRGFPSTPRACETQPGGLLDISPGVERSDTRGFPSTPRACETQPGGLPNI